MYSSRTKGGMHCRLVVAVILLLSAQLAVQVPLPSAEEPASLTAAEGRYNPVEEARKLWNGAKKLGRKMTARVRRRSAEAITVDPSPSPEVLANNNVTESAPKYILEVYQNLSRRPEPTEANTIRSLQTIATENGKTISGYLAKYIMLYVWRPIFFNLCTVSVIPTANFHSSLQAKVACIKNCG